MIFSWSNLQTSTFVLLDVSVGFDTGYIDPHIKQWLLPYGCYLIGVSQIYSTHKCLSRRHTLPAQSCFQLSTLPQMKVGCGDEVIQQCYQHEKGRLQNSQLDQQSSDHNILHLVHLLKNFPPGIRKSMEVREWTSAPYSWVRWQSWKDTIGKRLRCIWRRVCRRNYDISLLQNSTITRECGEVSGSSITGGKWAAMTVFFIFATFSGGYEEEGIHFQSTHGETALVFATSFERLSCCLCHSLCSLE